MMSIIINSTEQRYQIATSYYTEKGMLHALRKQLKFLSEAEQKSQRIQAALTALGTISTCTYKGVRWGKYYADALKLKDHKRTILIVGAGASGFTIGVGLGVLGQAVVIEHSERLRKWEKQNINKIVEKLIQEEFEQDPIWAQFICPIGLSPMFMPVRIPSGAVCDYKHLIKCADQSGMVKDIYNKKIPEPNVENPDNQVMIYFHFDATLADQEMMIVIYKRFRHFATSKSNEEGIGPSTRQFFVDYKNALADFITPIYLNLEGKITNKRNLAQSQTHGCEELALQAEEIYEKEMRTFKLLFGRTPLSDIDWNMNIDWMETLNKRWMSEHHS